MRLTCAAQREIPFQGAYTVNAHMLGALAILVAKCTAAALMVAAAASFIIQHVGFAFALLSTTSLLGLPVGDPWFDVFVVYLVGRWLFVSVVNGMPEPEAESSPWYIWCYRSMHSLAHMATSYFSHKNMWRYISGMREGGE